MEPVSTSVDDLEAALAGFEEFAAALADLEAVSAFSGFDGPAAALAGFEVLAAALAGFDDRVDEVWLALAGTLAFLVFFGSSLRPPDDVIRSCFDFGRSLKTSGGQFFVKGKFNLAST